MQPLGAPLRLTGSIHLGREPGGGSGVQRYRVNEDQRVYCVKLKGNRQGIRVLFNDFVCSRIGELIGVPLGEPALITISEHLLPKDDGRIPNPLAGIQFACERFEDGQQDLAQLRQTANFRDLCSVPVMDTFVMRADSRQHLCYPSDGIAGHVRDRAAIFDHGFAFNGQPAWTIASLRAAHVCNVLDDLQMKQFFPLLADYEPFVQAAEQLPRQQIEALVNEPPLAEWEIARAEADELIDWLDRRKAHIRGAFEQYLHL